METIEYKVFYSHQKREVFYSRTKDFGIALTMAEEVKELPGLRGIIVNKVWIESVRKRVIHQETLEKE